MYRVMLVIFLLFLPRIAAAQITNDQLPLADAITLSADTHVIATVSLRDNQDALTLAATLAAQYDLVISAVWPLVSINVVCFVFATDGDSADIATALLTDQTVLTAYPVQTFETFSNASYSDDLVLAQDSLMDMGVFAAHAVTKGGGVKIAVVDTGAALSHSDLVNQQISIRNFVSLPGVAAPEEEHGTAIAALVAADAGNGQGMVGLAPDVQMTVMRACWQTDGQSRGRCNTFSLARALNFAILNDFDLINLSLGGPADPILAALLEAALDRETTVVAAALPQPGPSFPGSVARVITAHPFGEAHPSPKESIPAPGKDVLSAKPGDKYDFFSGSSVSSAHVSGTVALLLSLGTSLPQAKMQDVLWQASANGTKVLDACKAISLALGDPAACRTE